MLRRWVARRSWIVPLALLALAGPARAGNIFNDSDPQPVASAPSPPASGRASPARDENIFTSSDPDPGSAAATPAPGSYGWQIAVADVASIGVIVAGGAARSDPLATVGLAGWIGAGPVVHLVHGNVGRGAVSVALRLGLPVLGALVASRIAGSCSPSGDDECGVFPEVLGILGGVLAAETIDIGALAHGGQPATGRPPTPTPPGEFPIGLVVAPRAGGAVAGYCGRF